MMQAADIQLRLEAAEVNSARVLDNERRANSVSLAELRTGHEEQIAAMRGWREEMDHMKEERWHRGSGFSMAQAVSY